MSTWLARLKNQNTPETGATKPTKPTQHTHAGGFVGFVAHPKGRIQKIDGAVANPETPAANAPAIDPDRWCWPHGPAMNTAEIETVKDMLDILELKGAVVTLDALHCQRETLEKISEKKAHVVVQVKNNQPKLYQAVQSQFQSLFDAQKEKIVVEHKESGHGRQEERYVFQLKAKLPPELTEKWPTIRSIIAVERHRSANGKGTVDTSYYVSSLSPKHKLLGHYIRQHWRIENSQHYILDVVFNEDASRIAMEDAVENMALFRRFVLNIVKQSNCGARSQRNKLKRAGWNDDYRAQLFFG